MMKHIIKYLGVLFVFLAFNLNAQELPQGICKIEDGNLVFEIDLRWNKAQQEQLKTQFDLDSAMIAAFYNGKKSFEVEGEIWEAEHLDKFHLRVFKPVQKRKTFGEFLVNILTGIDEKFVGDRPGYVNGPVYFGFNNFEEKSVKQNKTVRFLLKGHQNAEEVFLAGSFNNWLTYDQPMAISNGVWYADMNLKPGKYYYKFIVDGNWMQDPANLKGESDGVGSENSVLYVTNHVFRLKGYKEANNVVVAGSFNGWNSNEAHMEKTADGWELKAYVSYGRHYYKFVVDGQWITDPGNPNVTENEYGTDNSVLNIGDPATFTLKGYENAKNVFLAGSFNGWKGDEVRMKKTNSGWQAKYYIAPGNYEYKFVVDGQWIADPDNPITHGTGEFVNSFFVYKPNHTFVLEGYDKAKTVIVTGSFNGWIHHGYKMKRRNNRWELDLFIPEGKVAYKFIVDGEWIIDPANPDYETNQYNTHNSVIWIE